MTVALLGTGQMGTAMARSLAGAGHELVLYNRTLERVAGLADELGATIALSPASAAEAADVCLTVLADDEAVRNVFLGPTGLFAGARPGSVLVNMSTVSPDLITSLAQQAPAGVGLLDAPVSGSVASAAAAQLAIMVGGSSDDLEHARSALASMSRVIFHMGPLGCGAAMKLAVNAVIFGLYAAVAEGLVLAESSGIERTAAYDVLAGSAAGAPMVTYKRDAFVSPDTTPPTFALDLAAKDLGLILDFAAEYGVPMPQTERNLDTIRSASADVGGEQDLSAVAVLLRSRRTGAIGTT